MQELRGEPRLLKHYFCGHIYLDGSDHGSALKSLDLSLTMNRREDTPTFSSRSLGLWILGLGTQYPSHLLGPEKLDAFVKRFHDVENPGIKKLLRINCATGIRTRSTVLDFETGCGTEKNLPSIAEIDILFRTTGVDMAVQACTKAIDDWEGEIEGITHTVAVTCTNQGNPGFDLLVNERLCLSSSVDRTLLHGVGCAGGLAIMRTAAQLACGSTMRGRPARILCYACEITTSNVRYEFDAAAKCVDASQVCIAGALFSDAAAAFILCNDLGLQTHVKPVYELLNWDVALIPGTKDDLAYYADADGYRTTLGRAVPKYTVAACDQMFQDLLPSIQSQTLSNNLSVADFDWALHPGGQAIIDGVQEAMSLTDQQLRATRELYRTRGNSSSPTVLAILDRLRYRSPERKFVVATAFGPGLSIEMSVLRPCAIESSHIM